MAETTVREAPILFSGEMVRAILEGRKAQSRRVVKPQPSGEPRPVEDWARAIVPYCGRDRTEAEIAAKAEQLRGSGLFPFAGPRGLYSPSCPYGKPGDRLWVREAHHLTSAQAVIYRADYPRNAEERGFENIPPESEVRWRPSIHMPRWASRITLEITDVCVERVQEISAEDCIAEGATYRLNSPPPRIAFRELWDSINGPRGYGWDANPWVWALTFRRVEVSHA